MFLLHKEKERIRHQNQVKLLNEVIKLIPSYRQEPQTKVKKLRHIVLYNSFLKMIHSGLKKHLCIPKSKKKVNNMLSQPVYKRPKVIYHMKEKSKRAHIIFVQADKSANQSVKRQENSILKDNQKELTLVHEYDYQVPDVLIFANEISNNALEVINPSDNVNRNEMNYNTPISSVEHEVPAESAFMNDYEQTFNHFTNTYEDLSSNKENFCSTQGIHLTRINNCNSVYENVRIRNQDSFYNIQPNDSEDYILEDLAISNTVNQNNVLQKSQKFTNLSDKYDYPYFYVPGDYFHQIPTVSNNCIPKYHVLEELPAQSSVSESSGDSPARLNIDIENLSNSNTSCVTFSDSSSSLNNCDSSSDYFYDSRNLSCQQALPNFSTIQNPQSSSNLPELYSNCSYLKNNPVMNNVSIVPLYDIPQYCYSENMFSEDNFAVFPSESVHFLPGRSINAIYEEMDSGNSSPSRSFQVDNFSPQPNCEFQDSKDFSDSFPEDSKPIFSEETSIPLNQYLESF